MLKCLGHLLGALILLSVLSCGHRDTPSVRHIPGLKSLTADYSAYIDPLTIPEEEIPVEAHGFITMSASSSGDVIIAGAAHGKLYYSADGGVSWFTLEGIGVEEYWTGASVSADGQTIAVVGQGLYVSFDSGDNWTVYPFDILYDANSRLRMSDDGTTLIRYADYELEISSDFGETWSTPTYPIVNSFEAVELSADGQTIGALNYYEPLRLSTDGGLNWQEVTNDILDLSVADPDGGQWSDMAMSPNGQIIALLDAGAIKYHPEQKFDVYLSLDTGASWSIRTVEGIQFAYAIAMSDEGEKLLVSGNTVDDPFMFSEDYGVTWHTMPAPQKENDDWPRFTHVFSNGGKRIVTMESEYSIWTTDDQGQTWIKRLQGLGEE